MSNLTHWASHGESDGDRIRREYEQRLLEHLEGRTKGQETMAMIKVVVKDTCLLEGQGRTLQAGYEFEVEESRFENLNAECGGMLEKKGAPKKSAVTKPV